LTFLRDAIVGVMQVSTPTNIGLKPAAEFRTEWYRVNACIQAFGLSRPALFKLIALNKIKSVHIKQPGSSKGIRLISAVSMREYIGSFEDAK
jgi:hypothetical protein